MIIKFFDQQDESNLLNGSVIFDDEHLSRILDNLRTREPFLGQFFHENGYNIMVGIGGAVGCVQYSRSDGDSAYLMAVASNPIPGKKDVEFLLGGTLSPVSVRYILPFEQVKEIAKYFRETGARSAKVSWEEFSPAKKY
jgi:hypothetical protein